MEIEQIPPKRSIREHLQLIPERISQIVEHFFYQLGLKITKHPERWIIGSLVAVACCTIGFYKFRQERNPLKLWVPPDSDFIRDTEWLMSKFGEAQRQETIILTGDDVLTPDALYELNEITTRIIGAQSSHPQIAWTDVCFKVPVVTKVGLREKRDINELDNDFFDEEPGARLNKSAFEPSVHASSKTYCSIFNSLQKACLLFSILDIWEFDSKLIKSQSKDDIIEKLNMTQISPTLGHPMNYTQLLGGIARDGMGRIISARAVKTEFVAHVNFSKVNLDQIGNDAGTTDWATSEVLEWESAYLNQVEKSKNRLEQIGGNNLQLWYEAGRSFADISSATMFQDIDKLSIGIILMFLYVQLVLSNYNWVEWRFFLSSIALLCIGAAFLAAVGACSLFGVPYGPVHNSLPFMLMGLGVDDAFVMAASWEQVLSEKINRNKPLQERVALMLSHAGSAICITSLTDVVAFIIGTSTILPCLQSFCIYASVGVLATFLLQVTIFVACFMMDAKRIEGKRNGAIPCIVHSNYQSAEFGTKHSISWNFIDRVYSKVILTRAGKIIVLLITIVLASFGGLGAYQLEQWFDPMWFLPEGSHLSDYIQVHSKEFPERGQSAFFFISEVDVPENFPKLIHLVEDLRNLTYIANVKSWPHDFAEFVDIYYGKDIQKTVVESKDFYFYLSKFLFSQKGGKYQSNFRFAGNLTCGESTPEIFIASVDFTFFKFSSPTEWIPAMDESKRIVASGEIDGLTIVWSKMFASWVTDKVIAQEVTRNILLALVCVMGMTTLLIAEPQTCFWILLCVLLTLLDVCGFMFYWGLTIDIVSCIGLELAVGLSVDYAAHVAHAFLIAKSQDGKLNRRSRILTAVRHIGAAVTYGAGSTLLALSLLVFSRAYVFQSFFKIFLLVIVIGLWHGLFLLPVVLSTIGPRSLHREIENQERELQTIKGAAEEESVPLNKS